MAIAAIRLLSDIFEDIADILIAFQRRKDKMVSLEEIEKEWMK